MRMFCLLLILVIAAGCGGGGGQEGAAPPTEVFRGHATFGHEVRTFRPCEGDEDLWAVDATGTLWTVHKEFAAAGTGLFAVVEGRRGPAPAEGFGAEYPGALEVTAVLYLGREGPDCGFAWDRFRFQAMGNEPFWAMVVTDAGLVLKRPGDPDLAWPAVAAERDGDRRRFVGAAQGDIPAVELVIEPGAGHDSMSGSYFGLTATLTFGDTVLEGQALVGTAP